MIPQVDKLKRYKQEGMTLKQLCQEYGCTMYQVNQKLRDEGETTWRCLP
jgi:transcriptional regulator with XRE-family HTH domain